MPRHENPENTKPEILEAAKRLFLEKGWDGVNIQDICESVGVTRGAFYHYFKSREEIIDAVTTQMFTENNPFALAIREKGLSGIEKLRLAFQYAADPGTNPMLSNDFQNLMGNPVVLKNELHSSVHLLAPLIEAILLEGVADGSIQTEWPRQASQAIAVLINMWLSPAVFPVSSQERADKLAFMGDLLERMGIPALGQEIQGLLINYGNN